jgi:acyl dehydratase
VTITEKSDDKRPELGKITEHVQVFNQHGEIVLVADHLLLAKRKTV